MVPANPAMPTYLGMPPFPEAARTALADSQLRHNLAHATGVIRAKRAGAVAELSDWAELRAAGAAIKDDGLADEAADVERQPEITPKDARARIRAAVESRYTAPAEGAV